MFMKTITTSLVVAAALLGTQAPALASEVTQPEWAVMMTTKGMDKNHDGMVSKKEFLEMMAKAYDMKAKAMKADKAGITEAQLQEFLKSLYVGG